LGFSATSAMFSLRTLRFKPDAKLAQMPQFARESEQSIKEQLAVRL